jgi:hypothetical protein
MRSMISMNGPLRGKFARFPFTSVHSSTGPMPWVENWPPSHWMSLTSTMRFTPSLAACTEAAQPASSAPTMSKSASSGAA